jgi:hypothetical protein
MMKHKQPKWVLFDTTMISGIRMHRLLGTFGVLLFMLAHQAHGFSLDRRSYIQLLVPQLMQVMDLPTSSSSSSSSSSSPLAEVTDKVFFDIRISRQDGSSYVRDDLPDTFENRVINARLTIGLFGKQAPK